MSAELQQTIIQMMPQRQPPDIAAVINQPIKRFGHQTIAPFVAGLTLQASADTRITLEAYQKRYTDYPVARDYPQLSPVTPPNTTRKPKRAPRSCSKIPAFSPANTRVIARKVSCGQKTPRGAAAWEILASLAATCAQRAEDFVEFLAPRLRLSPEG